MITFSNISLQSHGILARSRANSALGALTLRKDALLRIDTPTGYFADGMLMAESSDILAAANGTGNKDANPYLYASKEYLTTGTANLLDFTARTYDPSLPLFQTQDPKSGDYTPFLPYLYCGSDPVNRIDPDGRLVIFVGGFHTGDGGTPEYWEGTDDIIMDELDDHHALYLDGSNGGIMGLFENTNSNKRCANGYVDGRNYAKEILNSLADGETIKFVSHSMGASYTEGFIVGMEYYGNDINVNIDVIEKIEFELDIAPYQADQQIVHDGVPTFTLQHSSDIVAIPHKIKNADNRIIHTQLLPGIFDISSHKITSFSEEIQDMTKHIRKRLD